MATQPDLSPIHPARASVHEPLGRRELAAPFTVGAPGSDLVVPDVGAVAALTLDVEGAPVHVTVRGDRLEGALSGTRLPAPRH